MLLPRVRPFQKLEPKGVIAMIIDRIFEDSLGFVRRLLWSRADQGKHCPKPFSSLQTIAGEQGLVARLEGRDSPRAVSSWLYSPRRRDLHSAKMVAHKTPMDLHLYLDFLGPLPQANTPQAEEEREVIQAKRSREESVPTHRVQIFKASHFLNAEGCYNYELIFWQDCDLFLGQSLKLDRLAQILASRLAQQCLKIGNPLDLKPEQWQVTLDEIWNGIKAEALEKLAQSPMV